MLGRPPEREYFSDLFWRGRKGWRPDNDPETASTHCSRCVRKMTWRWKILDGRLDDIQQANLVMKSTLPPNCSSRPRRPGLLALTAWLFLCAAGANAEET